MQPAGAAEWLRLSNPHFELLTAGGEREGRDTIHQFERLRRFFAAQGVLRTDVPGPVRIIAFDSPEEYAPYRLSNTTDAYNVGTGGRDYIVLPSSDQRDASIAAHEYEHVVARRQGLKPPTWLAEGLAEFFSTVQFQPRGAVAGEPKPGRLRQLREAQWLPLAEVLAAKDTRSYRREQIGLFYAESWALTHMLMISPGYKAHFSGLLSGRAALQELYGKPPGELEREVRVWVLAAHLPVMVLPDGRGEPDPPVRVEAATPFDAQFALAELLDASGRQEQALALWREMEASRPGDARVQAALGRAALARGKTAEARERFHRALALGIRDAQLCAGYATLARDAGLPEEEVIAAFDRALKLDPGLDDARYNLGLLHMDAGRYDAALPHFLAMHQVPEGRAFAYYVALAHTQTELGLREDATRSAAEARKHAQTDGDRELADELSWIARSEVVVQLSPSGPGRLRRIPIRHSSEAEVNPFIAPGDRIERQEGILQQVDCAGTGARLTVLAAAGPIILSMPDLGRVQVRKTTSGVFEFTCGPQQGLRVLVEYAAAADPSSGVAGVLRGIEMR
jgi:tetratricopeptide (TPR) repeat protein